jgi:hypothetical protein
MHNDLIIPSDNADTSNEKEYYPALSLWYHRIKTVSKLNLKDKMMRIVCITLNSAIQVS